MVVAQGLLEDVGFIGQALGDLLKGNFPSFFEHLLEAIDGIGVFLIIYGLMMFVSKITIFKAEEHHKYAHMFGIGVALIGMTNAFVYDLVTELLAGTLLTLIIILVVVFGIIILLNHLNKHRHEAKEASNIAKVGSLSSSNEVMKEESELASSKRLFRRERKTRRETRSEINDLSRSTKNMDKLVSEMQKQLAHASTLQSQGQSTREIRQGILDRMSSFVSALHKGYDSLEGVKSKIRYLEQSSIKDIDLTKVETNDFDHLFDHFSNGNRASLNPAKEEKIKSYGRSALALENKKKTLLASLQAVVQDAESNESRTVTLQKQLSSALESGNISEASGSLSEIRSHLIHIKEDNNKLTSISREVDLLSNSINNFHIREGDILRNILSNMP